MPSENTREVYRQLRLSQDKYTYFLLAVAGAGIALAVRQTTGDALAWWHTPLAGAVITWGFSFFCGCLHLSFVGSVLYANLALHQVQAGEHPKAGTDPETQAAAAEGLRSAIESNEHSSQRYADCQFRLLILGALLFIAWHVLVMYLRTLNEPTLAGVN